MNVGWWQASVVLGTLATLALDWRHGFLLETAGKTRLAADANPALLCWPAALFCGGMIVFAGD